MPVGREENNKLGGLGNTGFKAENCLNSAVCSGKEWVEKQLLFWLDENRPGHSGLNVTAKVYMAETPF